MVTGLLVERSRPGIGQWATGWPRLDQDWPWLIGSFVLGCDPLLRSLFLHNVSRVRDR